MSASATVDPVRPAPLRPVARREVIPGKRLALGYTLTYVSLLVLIPLGALVLKTTQLTWKEFWDVIWKDEQVRAAYKLSFSASAIAAIINSVFGLVVAWVLVRYKFPGRRLFDAVVDFPFALPTAVAGLTFSSLYSADGWLGTVGRWIAIVVNWGAAALDWLVSHTLGRRVGRMPEDWLVLNNTFAGVVVVLMFVGFPFVVRSVQSVLQDWDVEMERAASSLGATRWTSFRRVVFPALFPAWLGGLALAFARAVGEYGSVIFIASNIPGKSEIAPLRIMTKLDDFRYAEATAVAVVLLGTSLLVLLFINGVEWWSRRYER
jgi:sulfate transport system permease protein